MSDWKKLKGIVDEMENVVHSPSARNNALNKLARSNIHMLTKELLGEKQLNKTDDRFQVFNNLFGVADLFMSRGQKHPIFGDLADIAEKLASAGRYFPHAPIFLERILKRYAATPEDANQAEIAFKGLIAGINKSYEDLSRISVQILSFLMPHLNYDKRKDFIKAFEKVSTKFFPDIFTPSLEHYDNIVTRAEEATSKRHWKSNKPWSVISVHSHKGGVGKTTMAIALAAELAKAKKRVCLVDCDDEGPSLYQSFHIDGKKPINVLFLIDWFMTEAQDIPSGLIQRVSIIQNKLSLSCVPSSFINVDIGLFDELQHGESVRKGKYTILQDNLERLIQILIQEKKFDCVVIDNGPGLAHFALDVLMATLSVGGSHVFVLRPRITDICQLCLDYDWLWFHRNKKEQLSRIAVVFNAISTTMEGDRAIDLSNGKEIVTELEKWPHFHVYSHRYFNYDSARPRMSEYFEEIFNLLKNNITKIPAIDVLRHADEFYKSSKSHAAITTAEIGEKAKSILRNFGFKGNINMRDRHD